ncbi:MAG TPA: HAD-IIIA family hydrolase [Chitinophagaceae bacterium]|nr:HAD-IIIA family hydrolase [Chitinophagaceae bacterium]
MIKEAIILAGGLGTRLKDAVPDLPKCMAPVVGRPFLFYVINYLRSQGVEKFIFSLGYKHEIIQQYLNDQFSTLQFQSVIEQEPLGTGGAIQLACTQATEALVVVVNGDTLFKADLHEAFRFHDHNLAECTLLLKPMKNFDRYGVVSTGKDHLVSSFQEKQHYESGNINAGMYVLQVSKFLDEEFPQKFSFEKDYLEKYFNQRRIYGLIQDKYFIDIGIPEDYYKAQIELDKPPLDLSLIDKRWTIFVDRDGVFNPEKENDYIRNLSEFSFYPGVVENFKKINDRFGKVVLVSNQRGIGKGLMSLAALHEIEAYMSSELEAAGGHIDKYYYCTNAENHHPDRKPNPGMIYHAKSDFPEIKLDKAIMIGNKPTDMLFARNGGVYSVFIATTNPETPFPHPDIDLRFPTLVDFANSL